MLDFPATYARQHIPRQRAVRNLVEPPSPALAVRPQRQEHVTGQNRDVVIEYIVQRRKAEAQRGCRTAVVSAIGGILGAILKHDIEPDFEQDFISRTEQEDRRKISLNERAVLAFGLPELHFRIADDQEVLFRIRTGHGRRFGCRIRRRVLGRDHLFLRFRNFFLGLFDLLLCCRGRLLRGAHQLLETLNFLLISLVRLLQLLYLLGLLLHLLLQRLKIFVGHGGRNGRQPHGKQATGRDQGRN